MTHNISSDDGQNTPEENPVVLAQRRILEAALPHVAFDGWSDSLIALAAQDAEVDEHTAKLAFPRGGVDLALFFHREGDRKLRAALAEADLGAMRVRERVAFAIRTRLELVSANRDAVRKGATLFALPFYASDGARAMWETADIIWTALGDPSDDLNWYSKRAILSGVYGSAALFWLGDESEGAADTWAFVDRRIEDVMRFEQLKSKISENPLGRALMAGPNWFASKIRKPSAPSDLPGGS